MCIWINFMRVCKKENKEEKEEKEEKIENKPFFM